MILPSIPDNTYKFLLYVGLIIIGFSAYQSLELTNNYNKQAQSFNDNIDSLKINEIFQKRGQEHLINVSKNLSKRYGVENPITQNDSTTIFNRTLKGNPEEIFVSDTLDKLWSNYLGKGFEVELLSKKIDMSQANLNSHDKYYYTMVFSYLGLLLLGGLLSMAGYAGMERHQKLQERLLALDINQKDIKFKFCQSCGKKFSSVRLNGKNENSVKNEAFCIDCYDLGKFKEPNLTISELKKIVLKEIEFKSKKEKEAILKNLEKLDRWTTDYYS